MHQSVGEGGGSPAPPLVLPHPHGGGQTTLLSHLPFLSIPAGRITKGGGVYCTLCGVQGFPSRESPPWVPDAHLATLGRRSLPF